MAVINYSKKEISAKIVYYGPSLCGKTTNIQSIYASIKPDQKGKLVSLATEADRTLFFDFLPIEIANIRGFKTRLHFYTVPGQVYYNSTRRAVLTGVDGLVFVADSQRDKMEENIESLNNLEENLNYYGKSIKTIPLVIQYNKRDLPDVSSVAEMEQILNPYGYPSFEAVATTGEGVLETLTKVTKMVLQHIEMGTSGKQQRPAAVGQPRQEASPVTPPPVQRPAGPQAVHTPPPTPQAAPAPRPRDEEPPMDRHLEPTIDLSSYEEPAPARQPEPILDLSRYDEAEPAPETSLAPDMPLSRGPEPRPEPTAQTRAGRIQIVGTENAEIISANAISIPIRVKIDSDSKVYRMDLAIKLDGFKPEG